MIAIHVTKGSFSDKWIEYCRLKNVDFKLVDCYSTSILDELKGCKALMWHWYHNDYKAKLFARQLIMSLEKTGLKIFPDINTSWHFDDKLGQKYLLEAIKAPLVESFVFYDINGAIQWAKNTQFPKVFKLRRGAGAQAVKMVKSTHDANIIINKAFSKGFRSKDRTSYVTERVWHFKRDRTIKSFLDIVRGIVRVFIPNEHEKHMQREKDYVYFQEFIPHNNSDIRVIVIGKRAFAIKRMVRENDFRASGSGKIVYDKNEIPLECVKIAFNVADKLQAQCIAYDFVFSDDKPLLVEISYSFAQNGYLQCQGYWDSKLKWVEGKFTPEYFMIQDILQKI